jgi:large subunit ribosomal protein L22
MKSNEAIEAVSFSRYVRISPSKVRRILDQIRGRSYTEALMILKFMPHKSCGLVLKGVLSARANLSIKFNLEDSNLFIKEARADSGPFLKRFCPHAQGRGFPIKKQMSHIVS